MSIWQLVAYVLLGLVGLYVVAVIRAIICILWLPAQDPCGVLVFTYWCPNNQLSAEFKSRLDKTIEQFRDSRQVVYIMPWDCRKSARDPISHIGQLGKDYLLANGFEPWRVKTFVDLKQEFPKLSGPALIRQAKLR